MPPTPQQSLQPSIEAVQLQTKMEDLETSSCEMVYEGEHRWTARDRTVIGESWRSRRQKKHWSS